jgi:hypothetical protein
MSLETVPSSLAGVLGDDLLDPSFERDHLASVDLRCLLPGLSAHAVGSHARAERAIEREPRAANSSMARPLPMSTGVRIASTPGQGVEVRLDVRRLVWPQTAVAALPCKRAVPRPSGKARLPPSRVDVVLPVVLSEHAARPPLGRKAGRKSPPVGTR